MPPRRKKTTGRRKTGVATKKPKKQSARKKPTRKRQTLPKMTSIDAPRDNPAALELGKEQKGQDGNVWMVGGVPTTDKGLVHYWVIRKLALQNVRVLKAATPEDPEAEFHLWAGRVVDGEMFPGRHAWESTAEWAARLRPRFPKSVARILAEK